MTQEAAEQDPETKPTKKKIPQGLRFALELGPLILFFVINAKWGIFTATAVLMLIVPFSLAIAWKLAGRMPVMPMATAALVLVFGGLTLFLNDEEFIKIKVTILYVLFGAALLIALRFNRLLLPVVFDAAIHLDDAGWRKLTWRWSLFFFFLAGLNEVLRHTLSTDHWVSFKVFGIVALTLVFVLTQTSLMMRHEIKPEDDTSETHF